MGMLQVGHNDDPRFVHGLFLPKPGTVGYYHIARAGFRIGSLPNNWRVHFCDSCRVLSREAPQRRGGIEFEEVQPERDSRATGGRLGEHHHGPLKKGKEPGVMEEALEQGYTLRELCEVEDRVGLERYFATVMTWLKVVKDEDPLMPRWSAIVGSNHFGPKVHYPGNTCAGLCIQP
ncbi:hypothetical protein BHM03_00026894 [Ensete ventricosum]|nr:hypothetical protein BHM03_00026894 [Ensete ventricosum]